MVDASIEVSKADTKTLQASSALTAASLSSVETSCHTALRLLLLLCQSPSNRQPTARGGGGHQPLARRSDVWVEIDRPRVRMPHRHLIRPVAALAA